MKRIPRYLRINYTPGTYVREFDGWRGVGICFVLLAHYFPHYFAGSWVFMEMFFVMSGFLITGILLDSKSKKDYYTTFIAHRIVRIFPLYYLCLAIVFFLISTSWLDLSYYREKQAWFWLYGQNWLFSVDGWPKTKGLYHFWSLAIEEQFYIVWPLIVWLFSSKGLMRFCIFLFFFSIVFRNTGIFVFHYQQPFTYVATLGRMEGIALGAIIAIMVRSDRTWLEKYTIQVTMTSGILCAIAFMLAGTMTFQHYIHYTVNFTLVDIFFAGMIVLTMCDDQLILFKKLLNHPLFKQIGVTSYCLYIFHYTIQDIIQTNIAR